MATITAMVCPNCNGSLDVREGQKYSYCPYCGVKLLIDTGDKTINVNKTYHRIDDAGVERARAEAAAVYARERVKLKELEMEERHRKRKQRLIIIWIIALAVSIGLLFIAGELGFFAVCIVASIGGFAALISHDKSHKDS